MTIKDFKVLRKTHIYRTKDFGFRVEIVFMGWDSDLDEFVFCGTYYNPSGTAKRRWHLGARYFIENIRKGSYIPVK